MTLMILCGIIIDVIGRNQAAVRTLDVDGSQMSFKRRSPILRLKLVVLLPEIGPPIISVVLFEIGTIVTFYLDW